MDLKSGTDPSRLKSRCWQTLIPSYRLWVASCSELFNVSGGHSSSLAQGLFLYLQSQQRLSSLSHITFTLNLSVVTSPSQGPFSVFLFHGQEPFWLGDNTECVCVCTCVLSRVCLFVTPWAAVCQTLLSMEFSRQEYWSGLPFPSPGDLPNPGTEPSSLAPPELAGWFFTIVLSGKS